MEVFLEKYFKTIRKLFLEIGIKSITMDDISNKLGISKRTLYKEYASKSELVSEVFHKDFYIFRNKLITAQNSPDAVTETFMLFALVIEKQNSLSASTLHDLRKYYRNIYDEIFELINPLVRDTLIRTIKRGISEKNFRNDIDHGKIADIVLLNFQSLMMMPLNNIRNNSNSSFDLSILDYHFNSICTHQGLELWGILKKSNGTECNICYANK